MGVNFPQLPSRDGSGRYITSHHGSKCVGMICKKKSKEEGSLKVVNNQPNNRSGYIMMFADAKHNIKTRHVVDLLMRLPVVFLRMKQMMIAAYNIAAKSFVIV